MKNTALDIAKAIVDMCTSDGRPVSNLQLQNILYYLQVNALHHGRPMFSDDFEAWQFGPVVPDVYYYYCGFGAEPVRMHYSTEIDARTEPEIVTAVNLVRNAPFWDVSGNIQQSGKAWAAIYAGGFGSHYVIPRKLLASDPL